MRKWKCTESVSKNLWTVGKIYETDEFGNGLISDNGVGDWVKPHDFRLDQQSGAKFEEVKDFTLADLKPCMVVKLRNGWIARIEEVNCGLCVSVVNKETDWNELNDYNEDLTYAGTCGKSWDIMKVYGFCDYGCGKYLLNTDNRKLLWECIEKSPKQLKLEELETKQREIADEMAKLRKEME